ncbi:MAG: carboxylating nicotinate-nucleotide diphosphorylase [Candidatus Izemoplasmatales bacterium]|nr:carboxylating nicotinate-nucleotide diphosphorylase [Candidatus Izemoplasmatales bacterium]
MPNHDALILAALKEDMPQGDISSMYLFQNEMSSGRFLAKEDGVLSGILIAKRTFELIDHRTVFTPFKQDGDAIKKGEVIATVEGKTTSLLMAERVALNFMQRMSGIASKTAQFVKETEGTTCEILDTRKTTPLLRALEKQAVRDGGGTNHRFSLSDMVMLKDNHLKASGSIARAVKEVRERVGNNIKIEVEVESLEMLEEALQTDCDVIMLDNMSTPLMRQAVEINQGRKKLEASGNMTLSRIREVAATGVDYISVGALTHSFTSLDISLKF